MLLDPALTHASVPERLRRRVERRLRSGKRLLLVRALFYLVLFSALLGVVGNGLLDAVEEATGAEFLGLRLVLRGLVLVTGLLGLFAVPGILVVNRAISLLATDLYVLGTEVVARSHHADGPLPSSVRLGTLKSRKKR